MNTLRATTIGQLAAPTKSALATGPFGSAVSSKNFRATGVPMLRGSNLKEDVGTKLHDEELVFLEPELAAKFSRSIAKRGDIVFTNWGSVGQVGIIDETARFDSYIVSNKQMKMTPDLNQVIPLYLYYYLSQPSMIREVKSRAIGSTIPGFNLGQLRELPIVIPPLRAQARIVDVLSSLDDKIAANGQLAETLVAMAMAQFSLCAKSGKKSVPLKNLVTTQYGVTTSSHEGPGPKFLRVTDINKKPWIEWSTAPFCTVSETELAKYQVNPGDILVARMADPGKAAFVDRGDPEAVFASYLVRLRTHDIRNSLFIYYFLRSDIYQNYAEGAMQGSVQKNMNAKVIVATDISMPEPEKLSQFNEVVSTLRTQLQTVLKETRKLSETRDALLPHLMSGKLSVKDAESVIESMV